jgi:hypothetical protein
MLARNSAQTFGGRPMDHPEDADPRTLVLTVKELGLIQLAMRHAAIGKKWKGRWSILEALYDKLTEEIAIQGLYWKLDGTLSSYYLSLGPPVSCPDNSSDGGPGSGNTSLS